MSILFKYTIYKNLSKKILFEKENNDNLKIKDLIELNYILYKSNHRKNNLIKKIY